MYSDVNCLFDLNAQNFSLRRPSSGRNGNNYSADERKSSFLLIRRSERKNVDGSPDTPFQTVIFSGRPDKGPSTK